MDLDVRRLRLLREVALRGTIAAAADALGFTPSAVSQQLSTLERESATTLLERSGRGVRLTDAGRLLVERTGPVLVALEEARAALEVSRQEVVGDLRVAASGSVARALVVPVVAEVARDHPRLRLAVLEVDGDDGVRGLRLGELDVVVAHDYDHAPRPPLDDLVVVELFVEALYVAAPAGRFAGPLALADLAGEVWAADPPEASCGAAMRRACRAVGFEPDVRYNSRESAVVLRAVREGGAVALLPELALSSTPPGVDVLAVTDVFVQRRVFAARRGGAPVRPAVAVLLDRLAGAAQDLRGGAEHGRRLRSGAERARRRVSSER